MSTDRFFATCPRGLERILQQELASLDVPSSEPVAGGVRFRADLALAYRLCLWSRVASRVLAPLASTRIDEADDLYELVTALDWPSHFSPSTSFAIDPRVHHRAFTDSRFAAQRCKDAIVDHFRAAGLQRPSVDRKDPELKLALHIDREEATIAVDLIGHPLHQRGYRRAGGAAPLRENLAAGLLILAGWPAMAQNGGGLVDPMCGSGTLVIEAAMMAADIAPGSMAPKPLRGWLRHQKDMWKTVLDEAAERAQVGLAGLSPHYLGYDNDAAVLRLARDHARRAGLGQFLRFDQVAIGQHRRQATLPSQGLVICNPPYGERLGGEQGLPDLYRVLGEALIEQYVGWHAAVFTSETELAQQIRMRPQARHALFNGALACTLVDFGEIAPRPLSEASEMLANRLRKNLKRIRKYINNNNISCYRIYDRDLPDYAAAIDIYGDYLHIQEYQAPATIAAGKARARLSELVVQAGRVLAIAPDHIVVKQRRRQRGRDQYQRRAESNRFIWVEEAGLQLRVNLHDYLDTGLFLDHRQTRALIREMAAGKRFLNLFAYTGSATVYAAAGGAIETTSIDLSRTYLDWTRENLAANGFDQPGLHRLLRADCMDWLSSCEQQFDLIFVDPPTFSNSKRMEGIFDVHKDHVRLLTMALRCLAPNGCIVFSCNAQRFELDREGLAPARCEDITARTVPPDFTRRVPHRCWLIQHQR